MTTTNTTAPKFSRAPLYLTILSVLGFGVYVARNHHTEQMASIEAQKEAKTVALPAPVVAAPAPAASAQPQMKVEQPKPPTTTDTNVTAAPAEKTGETKKDEGKKDEKAEKPADKGAVKEPPKKEALPMKDKKLDMTEVLAKLTPVEVTIEEGEDVSFLMRACRPESFWRNDITNVQELAIARALNGIEKEDNTLLPNKKGDKVKLPCTPSKQNKKWATCQLKKVETGNMTVCSEAVR